MGSLFPTSYSNERSLWDRMRQIFYVWCTPTPYILYNHATNTGNFGFAGVALGIIQAQNIFGITNIIGLGVLYFAKNQDMCYVNLIMGGICMYLYGYSISRILELTRYLTM